MITEQLLYLSKPPLRLGGKDPIWNEAFEFYNIHHEQKAKPICHSDYLKVKRFVYKHFDFDAGYYSPGASGLSKAAKDEIRQIMREEIDRRVTVSVKDIQLPKDSIRFR